MRPSAWSWTMLALACLALAGPATAGPGPATDLTKTANKWWIHADADGPWMSARKDDGKDPYAGWGPASPTVAPPGLGWTTTSFPLGAPPTKDVRLDTTKKITLDVFVGGGAAGLVYVTPVLLVDGKTLASGEELSGTFVAGDLAHFTWQLTPRLDRIPAKSNVVWEFRTSGAYESAYYWMDGGSRTVATLPVV